MVPDCCSERGGTEVDLQGVKEESRQLDRQAGITRLTVAIICDTISRQMAK
jgi:hypothetical protein